MFVCVCGEGGATPYAKALRYTNQLFSFYGKIFAILLLRSRAIKSLFLPLFSGTTVKIRRALVTSIVKIKGAALERFLGASTPKSLCFLPPQSCSCSTIRCGYHVFHVSSALLYNLLCLPACAHVAPFHAMFKFVTPIFNGKCQPYTFPKNIV